MQHRLSVIAFLIAVVFGCAARQGAPGAPPGGGPPPTGPDPWPRQVQLPDASVLVYQPQVESWQGNQLAFRCAVAATPSGASAKTFGVIWGDGAHRREPRRAPRHAGRPEPDAQQLPDPARQRRRLPERAPAAGAGHRCRVSRSTGCEASLAASGTAHSAPRRGAEQRRRASSSATRRRSWYRSRARPCCAACRTAASNASSTPAR